MSQEQYKSLMSSLLKEKRALAKLRVELEGRKRKLCRSCKGFGHLARNCRNKNEEGKGAATPQNKFEILSSRVMQCGVEERMVRSVRTSVTRCFQCGDEGHKCYVCPRKQEKKIRVARPYMGKAHQRKTPARLERGKAQEGGEREVRKTEEIVVARLARGEAQQEWRKKGELWVRPMPVAWLKFNRRVIGEEVFLRKRALWHCGPTVPQDAEYGEMG